MNPHDAFDRILASLHHAALDDAHWPVTSALIDEASGTVGNALVVGDESDESAVYFARYVYRGERRPDLEREYFDLYHDRDEALPRLRALPAGQLVHIPDLYTAREKKSSPVYNEGLRRLGGQDGLDVHFDGPDGLRIVWAIGNPVGSGGWQSTPLKLVEHLVPHVRQFVVVRQALAAAEALGASLTGLLDNRRIGVLHLDRRGRLLAANGPARNLLRAGDGLFDRGGVLHAWLAADEARLQRLLGRALPGPGNRIPAAGSMTVPRPAGKARLGLHVSPVGDGERDFGARRVAALLLLVDPTRRPRIDPEWVAEALGLKPSEARVAALLAEGHSVRDIVAATDYRESYVRLLLKHVYKKQGLSGQATLVRRILVMEALLGR